MELVMINYVKLVMEQKWYIINQMDQMQIIQLLLILVVVIIFIQCMFLKIFSELYILEQTKTYDKHFIINTDMTGANSFDTIGTEYCIEMGFNSIGKELNIQKMTEQSSDYISAVVSYINYANKKSVANLEKIIIKSES